MGVHAFENGIDCLKQQWLKYMYEHLHLLAFTQIGSSPLGEYVVAQVPSGLQWKDTASKLL